MATQKDTELDLQALEILKTEVARQFTDTTLNEGAKTRVDAAERWLAIRNLELTLSTLPRLLDSLSESSEALVELLESLAERSKFVPRAGSSPPE